MSITINLTPVLVTLIICVSLYAISRGPKEKKKKELEVPEFVQKGPSSQEGGKE